MMDQQLDLDGNLHDLAPGSEQPHLFTSEPQIRGQLAIDTDRQTTVGKYSIEPPPADSEIAYVLVSPRGKRYGLLRNEPRPYMLFAIHMDRFGCAEHVGWFTDKDGTLKEAR